MKKRKIPKLNLIPIMDAVFIFIFFLLLSAQFLDIHEIIAEAPAVATFNEQINKKEPLNLVIEISKGEILVKTGLDAKLFKKIENGERGLDQLYIAMIDLKSKNIEENSVIIRPKKSLPYTQIVTIMEMVRRVRTEKEEITGTGSKGQIIKSKTLFDKIIFDSVM